VDDAARAILMELSRRPIELIVIGASAGGIETLGALLPALPGDLRASVLVVLHVPPDMESLLAQIFAPRCAVAVREALDKEPLEPATLLFAPPDYHLLVERGGFVSLSKDPLVHFSRPSIDVLFASAAWACGPRALGIILSGANRDGAEGLATIRREGGLVWAQDPTTAIVPTMPLAATARVKPDHVLTVEAMASVLGAFRATLSAS
jgi:two-component system, chemotaxis family, protein-glutamate methylesterase/glutaminase